MHALCAYRVSAAWQIMHARNVCRARVQSGVQQQGTVDLVARFAAGGGFFLGFRGSYKVPMDHAAAREILYLQAMSEISAAIKRENGNELLIYTEIDKQSERGAEKSFADIRSSKLNGAKWRSW